jgi:hypothetical protein
VVFDSITDMITMLRVMKVDPHVKIMRIKNRMSSGLKLCNALQFAEHFIISITNAFIPQTFYEKSWRNAILKQTFEFECVLSAYNSSATCGYRDVLVNMCFENDITTREFFERVSISCLCRVAIMIHVLCVVCVFGRGRECAQCIFYISVSKYMCLSRSISRSLFLSGLGINRHVCELQLALKEFVALRSLDGHKRYVDFRNMRCE